MIVLILSLTFGAVSYPDLAFELMFPGKDISQVETLHGRTQFWDDAALMMTDKPLIGYGYAMAAKVGKIRGTNMHNSFLSLVVGSGIVGAAFFLLGIIFGVREGLKLVIKSVPGAASVLAAFLTGLLNSNTLSFFGEDWRSASFVFICLWALIGFSVYQISFAGPRAEDRGGQL